MLVRLTNVRLAFPVIYKAETFQGEGAPAYSAVFLMSRNHPDVAKLEQAAAQVAAEKWGTQAAANLKLLKAQDRGIIHDGDLKAFDGYAGNVYVNARAGIDKKPHVLKRDKSPVTQGEAEAPYSGCYVDAQIEIWAQNNDFGKRLNARLLLVQFRNPGQAFSGGASADLDQMDDLSTEEDLS